MWVEEKRNVKRKSLSLKQFIQFSPGTVRECWVLNLNRCIFYESPCSAPCAFLNYINWNIGTSQVSSSWTETRHHIPSEVNASKSEFNILFLLFLIKHFSSGFYKSKCSERMFPKIPYGSQWRGCSLTGTRVTAAVLCSHGDRRYARTCNGAKTAEQRGGAAELCRADHSRKGMLIWIKLKVMSVQFLTAPLTVSVDITQGFSPGCVNGAKK